MQSETAGARFHQFEQATDLPLAFLALLIVPALILEDRTQNLYLSEAARAVNWIVWLGFCFEYLGKLVLAPSRRVYVQDAWFDLVVIVLSPPFLVPSALQGARAIRGVRVLRLLRFVQAAAVAAIGLREAAQGLRHRRFHYVLLVTVVIVAVGAIGIFAVESGANNNIKTIGDAFWWSIVTTTTVGYGDVSPVTTEGRLIAVALMVVGIGFLGILTATITSFFLEPAQDSRTDLEERMRRIEDKLDLLIRERGQQS